MLAAAAGDLTQTGAAVEAELEGYLPMSGARLIRSLLLRCIPLQLAPAELVVHQQQIAPGKGV